MKTDGGSLLFPRITCNISSRLYRGPINGWAVVLFCCFFLAIFLLSDGLLVMGQIKKA